MYFPRIPALFPHNSPLIDRRSSKRIPINLQIIFLVGLSIVVSGLLGFNLGHHSSQRGPEFDSTNPRAFRHGDAAKVVLEEHEPRRLQFADEEEAEIEKRDPEVLSEVEFMLVTGDQAKTCRTKHGSNLLMKSYKNKVDYCNMHGCRVWYCLETWDENYPGTWVRYPLLRNLMDTYPKVKWFMWMDSDALITDMSFSIPFRDYDTMHKNLVVPGRDEVIYGENPRWTDLNAGIILMRNCDWSKKFLEKWIDMGHPKNSKAYTEKVNRAIPRRPQDWPVEDQSALLYLLREHSEADRNLVHLEHRYTLHGYWDMIVDHYEEMLEKGNGKDSKWPFITHFCGCQFCKGNYPTPAAIRCVQNFQRAYHFADNQLLGSAGIKHSNLNTSAVEKL